MTSEEINLLQNGDKFPTLCGKPKLIETHISWVILCKDYVYKIKKPMRYPFLDFSTLEKRLFYCQQELRLNWRLTFNLYLDIWEVRRNATGIELGGQEGQIIDHALRMRRLDSGKQMDQLLVKNLVHKEDIRSLANKIATFHQKAEVITDKNVIGVAASFRDLESEVDFLNSHLGKWSGETIRDSIGKSNLFLERFGELLSSRLQQGYYRDLHGDLHARNIFLLPEPVIFDCIEFNDDYRKIDILNEIAFLCMDLDAFGREDLSALFLEYYSKFLSLQLGEEERMLFIYYKAYRANVRAKVNSLRARSTEEGSELERPLTEVDKYLKLMNHYMLEIQ
ncbi:MAG: hypothetical protein RLN86_00910 [Cyclobacteriaceae bacterium]